MVIALGANSLIMHVKVTCEGFTTSLQVFIDAFKARGILNKHRGNEAQGNLIMR